MRRRAARALAVLLIAVPVSALPLVAQEGKPAILVLENARVWTGDSAVPHARGLVIADGRISRLLQEEGTLGFPQDVPVRRIDLGGRRVVPGFNDAHTHFFDGGFTLLSPDLLTSDTPEEFVRRLKAYADGLPEGRWIDLSAAWDHERWPGHPLPSRQLIDSVTPANPVWIRRPDGHIGLANSLALEAAGITVDTPDPPGGRIDRDPATGEPTGIVRDAGDLIRAAIPEVSEEQYREALDAALAHAAEVGVTSVQDMCYDPGPVGIRLLEEYAREGRLTARVYCRTALRDWAEEADAGIRAGSGDAWVRRGSLKAFADGALGSSTAYMFEPYADNPENRGLLDAVMQPPDSFHALAAGADRAGLQLSIHAIGDAAISLVLDQFERIQDENPAWDRRFRIEHAQHMAGKDFARMAEMGVIASVQPFHAIDDGRWAERKIGPERAKTTYAFRTFLDAGVPLAFGTDWPVAPLEPMRTVYAAVTRQTLDGEHPDGWVPDEKITVEEALRAYTAGSAYAEFAEGGKGRLVPGALADLVVLSEDPFEVPPERLEEIRPVLTMVGGRIVYSTEDLTSQTREGVRSAAYVRVSVDELGQIHIVRRDGREIIPKRDAEEVGVDKVLISEDGRSVGWVGLYPNCCTSYPIPSKLMVYSGDRLWAFTGSGLPVWEWGFQAAGKQVAFRQETVHGGLGIHYELRDLATGLLIAQFDPPYDRNDRSLADLDVPKWVEELRTFTAGTAPRRPRW